MPTFGFREPEINELCAFWPRVAEVGLELRNPRGGAQLHVSDSTATGTILNTEDAALQASLPDSAFMSSSHSGTDDRPQVIVAFSEAVISIGANTPSVSVSAGTVASVQVHTEDGLENAWIFFLNPEGDDDVTFTLVADAACASGGFCTAGGTPLSQVPSARTISGPDVPDTAALSASFREIPASHDGAANFTFEVEFSEAPDVGYQRMRDHAFTIGGGSVKNARRVAAPSNLKWEITVEPTGDDDVTVALKTTADCGASDAICTSGGTPLSAVPGTLTIAGPDADDDTPVETVTALTASLSAMPSEHGGPGQEFTFELTFSESPAAGYAKLRDDAFNVSGGEIRSAQRLQQGTNIGWRITVKPDAGEWGNITISLPGGRACNTTGAICTSDGRMLSNSPSASVRGPAALSVADASAHENTDDTLDFVVTLDRASTLTVTVDYATSNGTATAGSDYTPTSGELTFEPGDVSKTVAVPLLNDAIDDGNETMTLTLSNASNARIADGTATGTINNSDPLQQAWIARFGRTVASEVVAGITERLENNRAGSEVRIAGVTLERNGTAWAEKPVGDAEERVDALEGEQTMSARDLLMQSAFRLQGGSDEPGGTAWTAWGRFSSASFEGESEGVKLSGDVTTGLLGADVGTDQWIAGMALSAAKGDGPFTLTSEKASNRASGTVDSSLTSFHPYAQIEVTDRVALWGIGGYGTGTMTIDQNHSKPIKTDIDMRMAAAGVRGSVLDTSAGDAFDLVLKSDALWLRTTSDATPEMAAAKANVTRLRLLVDASRGFEVGGRASLTPSIEAGVRRDAGDAEEGTGFEVGAGLRYQGDGITIEGNIRKLVAHDDEGYKEWGASGSIRIDPGTAGRGLSLTIAPTWGSTASEAEQLWSARDPSGLVRNAEFEAEQRLDAEVGYGFRAPQGFGLVTPYAGLALADGASGTLRTGLRWKALQSATLALEATRENGGTDTAPANAIMLRAAIRF